MNQLPFAPQAVIFDLDGTLADTFPLIVSSWNAAMQVPIGRTFTAEEVVARFGIPDTAMLRRELEEHHWEVAEAAYFSHYETEHGTVVPFEGILEMLQGLQALHLPLGVMTGKGTRTAQITVRQLGWGGIFGSVVTGEDVAEQKPAPEGVLIAARELGVQPERCVYVGDSPADIGAGQAAGMFTVAAGWHTFYHERLRACGPDYWAQTPAQVLDLVREAVSNEG